MNKLFTLNNTDFIIISLVLFIIILLVSFVIYTLTKKEKIEPISENERFDNQETNEEMFENIKPTTKEQQEAKEELERVFRQMSEDLQKQPTPKEAIEDFEREQEENAIISYQELLKQAEEKRKNPNMIKNEETVYHKEKVSKENEKPKRFRNSDIISPIFGIQSPKEYQKQREKEYEEININYKEDTNADFLNSLKEFRKNL